MAKIQNIRKLESVAVKIRDLAISKAPKDTGNLRNKIRSANTPAKTKMIKQLDDFSIELSLDYAPTGAEYGQWFNDPPRPNSKRRRKLKKTAEARGNWNYAIEAMNDDEVNKAYDAWIDLLEDYIAGELEITLNKR